MSSTKSCPKNGDLIGCKAYVFWSRFRSCVETRIAISFVTNFWKESRFACTVTHMANASVGLKYGIFARDIVSIACFWVAFHISVCRIGYFVVEGIASRQLIKKQRRYLLFERNERKIGIRQVPRGRIGPDFAGTWPQWPKRQRKSPKENCDSFRKICC